MKKQILAVILVVAALTLGVDAALAGTLTPATGGSAISADKTGGTWTTLTGPTYAEASVGEIRLSSGTRTIVLNAPAGFQFDTANPKPTVLLSRGDSRSNRNINNTSVNGTITTSVTATTVTLTLSDVSSGNTPNTLVWQNLRVRPTSGTPTGGTPYAVTLTATLNNVTMPGVTSGSTSLGALTEVAGMVNKLAFTVQPAGATYKTPFTTQPVVRTQDQFGNNTTAGLGSTLSVSISLSTGTGPLAGTTSLNIGTSGGNGTGSFSNLQINKAENGDKLTAAATGLTSATSSAFNVAPVSITVTATAVSKTYGDADPALTYQITSGSLLSGDQLSGALARVAGNNVGTYAIQQGTLAAGANYVLTYSSADLTIAKRPITVTAVQDNKVYDGTDTSSGEPLITSGSLAAGDTATWTQVFNSQNTTASHLIPSGSVNDGNGGNNYEVTFVTVPTQSIHPRPVTVTANDAARVYGEENPGFSVTYGNFVGSENASVFNGAPQAATTADETSAVGTYDIDVVTNGVTALNYYLAPAKGKLTVNKANAKADIASDKWTVPPTNTVTFTVGASALSPSKAHLSGNVQFVANGVNLGAPVALVNGQATLSVLGSALAHGSNTITAVFTDPNGNFNDSSCDLNPKQVVNTPPRIRTQFWDTAINTPLVLNASSVSQLNKDADYDALAVLSVNSTSTKGAAVTLVDGKITYTPQNNYVGNDSVTYTLADSYGGTVTGIFDVIVQLSSNASSLISTILRQQDGNLKIYAIGLAGNTYDIQASSDLQTWNTISTVVAPSNGVISYTDLDATNHVIRVYRLALP